MNDVLPWALHDGLGVCGPLLAQESRFSSSNRYWLWSLVPVPSVLTWLPFASCVMVKPPIAAGPCGCVEQSPLLPSLRGSDRFRHL